MIPKINSSSPLPQDLDLDHPKQPKLLDIPNDDISITTYSYDIPAHKLRETDRKIKYLCKCTIL